MTTLKPLTVWITTNCGKFLKRWEYQTTLPASCETCMQVKKQQLEQDVEQQIGSKLGKEYLKAVYCHPAYLTYLQSTSLYLWAGSGRWWRTGKPGVLQSMRSQRVEHNRRTEPNATRPFADRRAFNCIGGKPGCSFCLLEGRQCLGDFCYAKRVGNPPWNGEVGTLSPEKEGCAPGGSGILRC